MDRYQQYHRPEIANCSTGFLQCAERGKTSFLVIRLAEDTVIYVIVTETDHTSHGIYSI